MRFVHHKETLTLEIPTRWALLTFAQVVTPIAGNPEGLYFYRGRYWTLKKTGAPTAVLKECEFLCQK